MILKYVTTLEGKNDKCSKQEINQLQQKELKNFKILKMAKNMFTI